MCVLKKTIVVAGIFDVFGQERGVCKEIVKKNFSGLFSFSNIGGWVERNWKNLRVDSYSKLG